MVNFIIRDTLKEKSPKLYNEIISKETAIWDLKEKNIITSNIDRELFMIRRLWNSGYGVLKFNNFKLPESLKGWAWSDLLGCHFNIEAITSLVREKFQNIENMPEAGLSVRYFLFWELVNLSPRGIKTNES